MRELFSVVALAFVCSCAGCLSGSANSPQTMQRREYPNEVLAKAVATKELGQIPVIDAYGYNPSRTLACFRSQRVTYLLDTESRTCKPVWHSKEIRPTIDTITYDSKRNSFVLWRKGQIELRIAVQE